MTSILLCKDFNENAVLTGTFYKKLYITVKINIVQEKFGTYSFII